jgi:hypothetical protein
MVVTVIDKIPRPRQTLQNVCFEALPIKDVLTIVHYNVTGPVLGLSDESSL